MSNSDENAGMTTDISAEKQLDGTGGLALAMQDDALIMMVDDEALVIELTQALLEEAGYKRFINTTTATEALALMFRERPHVVLLDIQMPQMNGLQILERMRGDQVLRHIPVIVLTSADDPATKLKALELGATDFLRKPVDSSELVLRLRNTLSARAYQDFLASFDRTTGLSNRQRFFGELQRTLLDADSPGRIGALLQLSLDRFREINDVLGPTAGDTVLREAARRIRAVLQNLPGTGKRRDDRPFAARYSGAEYSILLPMIQNMEYPSHVASELMRVLAAPLQVADKELRVTASIGVALFPTDGQSVDELVKNAVVALRDAKNAGSNNLRFYAKDLNAKAAQRLEIEGELRRALEQDELRLFYQPKFSLARNALCGAEALVRWEHPKRGMVPPGEFIPVAEQSGLIEGVGDWVLGAACRQLRAWQQTGLTRVPVAVNVSPRQFDPKLLQTVRRALEATGQRDFLHLELTESSVMGQPQAAVTLLRELRDAGLRIAMDDFGTGYSSLSHLHLLPLHELKIDRSFVSAIPSDGAKAPLIDAIIAMAHSLGLSVVAEGVETEAQLEYLRRHGCDECQGYFFSKPLPAEEFAAKYLSSPGGRQAAG